MGVKPSDEDGQASWHVPFVPGILEARAGACRYTLATPGKPVQLRVKQVAKPVWREGSAVLQYEVLLADEHDVPAVGMDERIHVQLVGQARLLGIENGKPDDLTPYAESWRETYQGRALIVVRVQRSKLPVQLWVWTESGLSVWLQPVTD